MSIPKAKRTNPNKLVVTQADMKKVEERWQRELESMKADATSNASLYVQCVVMLALHNKFGFGNTEVQGLIEEMNKISERIEDETTTYSFEDVMKELEVIDVFVQDEWK